MSHVITRWSRSYYTTRSFGGLDWLGMRDRCARIGEQEAYHA